MTISRALPLLFLAVLAACADQPPTSSGEPPVVPSPTAPVGATQVDCVARVSEGTVSCTGPSAPGGARRAIIGGQGEYLNITGTGVSFNSGTGIFQGSFTVQNLLPYAIGTRNGVAADSGGVKVFIYQGPTTTGGGGDVTVANADGFGALTAANQPFFKYAQMIRADSVSAPKTWQFQLDLGVTGFTFSLLVYAETQASAFRLIAPEAGDTVLADSVDVRVVAAAPPRLTNIRASVDAASIQLAYVDSGVWRGKVPLSGNAGPRTLRVRARSPQLDSLVQTVPFVYGLAPVLSLTHPFWPVSVSRPQVRFAGTCTDNTSCTVTGRMGNTVLFTATGPSFDETVTLPEGAFGVRITAQDTDGDSVRITRTVYVEPSPRLVEVAPGRQVYAASPDYYFYRDSVGAAGAQLRLRSRGVDSTDVLVMELPPTSNPIANALREVDRAQITPAGVVFMMGGFGYNFSNGTLTRRAQPSDDSMNSAGRWVTWSGAVDIDEGSIDLLDVIADSVKTIALGRRPRVGPNGDVVYIASDIIWRYRAGVKTLIDGSVGVNFPVTDGNLIVYRVGSVLMLYDGSGPPTAIGSSNRLYEVNNGWVAWLGKSRAPDGTIRDLIVTGVFGVRAVGPDGQVVYIDGDRRYYSAVPYTTRLDVGDDRAEQVVFFGSRAFVTVAGVAAFEIVP